MSDAYIGEIRLWSSNRIPINWALCDGSLRSIEQDSALYNLIGTTYGGDNVSTFALPNLTGRIPVGAGQGPGLTPRTLGESGGEAAVPLSSNTMATHSHIPVASHATATDTVPDANKLMGSTASNVRPYVDLNQPTGSVASFHPATIAMSPGPNAPHDNMMPSAALNYIICVNGIFPPS